MFTNTDNSLYEIETKDVYENVYEDIDLFDFMIIQKIQRFLILSIKKLLAKWHINSKEKYTF